MASYTGALFVYDQTKELILKGKLDFEDSGGLLVNFLDSGYTFDATHTVYGDISAYSKPISISTITASVSTTATENAVQSLGKTSSAHSYSIYWAAFRLSGTFDGVVNPLVWCMELNSIGHTSINHSSETTAVYPDATNHWLEIAL